MTKRQAASSQQIDNLAALPTAADHRQLNSIQLGRDCRSVKSQSAVAAESCNSETASDAKRRSGKAASGKLVWNQH